MVLRGAQRTWFGEAKYNLRSTPSLPHNRALLYDPTGSFMVADLGGEASPCLDEVQILTDFHTRKSFSATRSQCREVRFPRNQLPDAAGTFSVPGHCPERLSYAVKMTNSMIGRRKAHASCAKSLLLRIRIPSSRGGSYDM